MPECKYCGEEFSSSVLPFHESWCKEQKKKEGKAKKPVSITELNAEPAIDLIEKTDNKEQIAVWYERESQNSKPRKTVIEALELKIKELETDNESNDNASEGEK